MRNRIAHDLADHDLDAPQYRDRLKSIREATLDLADTDSPEEICELFAATVAVILKAIRFFDSERSKSEHEMALRAAAMKAVEDFMADNGEPESR
jgi:hypothetical protein